MPTFVLKSSTAVVVKEYEYDGADDPKPEKIDLNFERSTTYGEVVQVGGDVTDLTVGDLVVYPINTGYEASMNAVDVRIIDETDILFFLT